MTRFYSPRELRGAKVYDSLGLLYGTLRGARVEEGTLLLEVVTTAGSRESIVDVDRLRERMGGRWREGATVEELVAEARRMGIDVPYKIVEGSVELLKGLVPVGEVLVADYSEELGLGVVALRTPREARYRGPPEAVGSLRLEPEERIRGKPVISASRGLLGLVEGYVIGPGEPGVRASRSPGEEGYINWLRFTSAVKSIDRGLYERLANLYNPLQHTTLPASELPRIRELLGGDALQLLEKFVVYRRRRQGDYVDVPWSSVVAVGDAVIVE